MREFYSVCVGMYYVWINLHVNEFMGQYLCESVNTYVQMFVCVCVWVRLHDAYLFVCVVIAELL